MPRLKNDPTVSGYREQSGFWRPIQDRIGRKMVKADFMTKKEWGEFVAGGSWLRLRATAQDPGLLRQADHREAFAKEFMQRPEAFAHFLVWFYDELRRVPLEEQWLFFRQVHFIDKIWARLIEQQEKSLGRRLNKEEQSKLFRIPTDKELAEGYTKDTGKSCTAKRIQRAREKIRLRVPGGSPRNA